MRTPGFIGRLARLIARWLYGLAARLDHLGRPRLAPLGLDALAARFPGAPEHWLAEVARHLNDFGEAVAEASSPALPDLPIADPSLEDRRASLPLARLVPSPRRRPTLRFMSGSREPEPVHLRQTPLRRSYARLSWPISTRGKERPATSLYPAQHPSPPPDAWQQPDARRAYSPLRWALSSTKGRMVERTEPTKATTRPELALNPSTPSGRSPSLYPRIEPCLREDDDFLPAPQGDRAPGQETWSTPGQGATRRDVNFGSPRPPAMHSRFLHFSDSHERGRPLAWPTTPETRWPDLPPHEQTIADAPVPAPAASDAAREQMVGSWSA